MNDNDEAAAQRGSGGAELVDNPSPVSLEEIAAMPSQPGEQLARLWLARQQNFGMRGIESWGVQQAIDRLRLCGTARIAFRLVAEDQFRYVRFYLDAAEYACLKFRAPEKRGQEHLNYANERPLTAS